MRRSSATLLLCSAIAFAGVVCPGVDALQCVGKRCVKPGGKCGGQGFSPGTSAACCGKSICVKKDNKYSQCRSKYQGVPRGWLGTSSKCKVCNPSAVRSWSELGLRTDSPALLLKFSSSSGDFVIDDSGAVIDIERESCEKECMKNPLCVVFVDKYEDDCWLYDDTVFHPRFMKPDAETDRVRLASNEDDTIRWTKCFEPFEENPLCRKGSYNPISEVTASTLFIGIGAGAGALPSIVVLAAGQDALTCANICRLTRGGAVLQTGGRDQCIAFALQGSDCILLHETQGSSESRRFSDSEYASAVTSTFFYSISECLNPTAS